MVRYSDGTEKATKPVCITGDKGAAGVSATEIMEEYYLSTSDKILLGGAWSEICPAWEKGKYIWTRSRCSWSDGTTTYTTPVFAGGLNSANDKADAAMGAVDAVEIKVNRLEAENVTIYGKLTASEAEINDLKAQDVTISGKLEAAQGNIETLTAGQVTITGKLTAAEADIEKLTVDQATITGKLTVAEADIVKLKADVAEVGDLSAITADIGKLKADVADIDTALIGKADIDLANIKNGCITTAMIGIGVIGTTQIADGSITDAKIVGLTANKITAGRLDAAQIEVVNLNAANITVGTINGVQIAPGAIDLDKLSGTVSGMINGAVDTANNAQTTADGKNKIYYQNTQPGLTGNKKGDTWFDTANGYRAYVWNGTAWSSSPFGSAAIADDAIVAGKIAANAITVSTIVAGAVTLDKLAADSVNASKIVSGSITAAQLAANTITGDKIKAGTIAAGNLAANSVTSDKIVADAVTTAKIAAKAVTANEMAAGSITASNAALADACIITAKIADGAITNAKIANATIQSAKIAALDAAKITSGYIAADRIQAKSLTADKLNVSTLSAITANLGTVTAGVIKSANYAAGSAGMQLTLSNGVWDSKNFKIGSDGGITLSGELIMDTNKGRLVFFGESYDWTVGKQELGSIGVTVTTENIPIEFTNKVISYSCKNVDMTIGGSRILSLSERKNLAIGPNAPAERTVQCCSDFEMKGGSILLKDKNDKILGLGFLNSVYPVGSIYMSVNSTSPATLFGGTWVELQGRFLLGRSSSYGNGSTGGRSNLTLRATIGAVDGDISALGYLAMGAGGGTFSGYKLTGSPHGSVRLNYNHWTQVRDMSQNTEVTNIMPPYLAVYMWKRTA